MFNVMNKYKIKDIARLAGVSAGSVDRVIHNRGEVSPETRKKVEDVMQEINYTPRTHSKTPKTRKTIKILVILPQHAKGEYWAQIENGINKAQAHYGSFNIETKYLSYNQYDLFSCKRTFNEAKTMKKDAVVFGPSFHDEAVYFCNDLSLNAIPYVYVDTLVTGTDPLSAFCPNNELSGIVQAKLMLTITGKPKEIVLFQSKRIGDEMSISSFERQRSFTQYIAAHAPGTRLPICQYDKTDAEENRLILDSFFSEHPDIDGGVVFNSNTYVIAEYLVNRRIDGFKLIGFGANAANAKYLKEDKISFLIEERPEYQGYMAIKTIVEFIFFGMRPKTINYTPIDILMKETIEYYKNPSFAFLF